MTAEELVKLITHLCNLHVLDPNNTIIKYSNKFEEDETYEVIIKQNGPAIIYIFIN